MDPIRFNCGEFRPGQEPIFIPPITTTVPPVIIPGGNPFPGRPTWIPSEPPPPDDPVPPIKIPPAIPGGPSQPSQPASSVPATAVPPGNTTTNPNTLPSRYRCTDVIFYCPEDIKKPIEQRRIKDIRRYCVICGQERTPEGVLFWPPGCVYRTKPDCEQACRDSLGINTCVDIGQVQTEPSQVQTQQTNNPVLTNNSSVIQNSIVLASQIASQTIDPRNVATYVQTPYNSVVTNQTLHSSGTLYSTKHNLIGYETNHQTTLVSNSRYPTIFNSTVAREVGYFLDMQNSISQWNEWYIFNLTNEKILLSLNSRLSRALNNIHHLGGIKVNLTNFLEAIRKHLIEGTLDYFDSNFFVSLYEKQKNDRFISYMGSSNKDILTRGALGLIAEGSIPADSTLYKSIQSNELKRQRRLNEDIEATVRACDLSGNSYDIELANAGIEICGIDGTKFCELGDGDGYYIEANTIDSCDYISLDTKVSATYYVPPQTRFNALSIMNLNPALNLRVTSLSGDHELVSGYTPSFSSTPKYFMLELSSVTDSPTNEPLVNRTYARYALVEDENIIQRETLNNGFAVSRVNINFDDPFIKYALDGSSIELEQNDITFRNFDTNRTSVGQNIISRNIPFGLILTPVAGSRHNPFNGNSTLERFTEDYVSRSISMIPTIDNAEKENLRSPLKEVNLFNNIGNLRVGVAEPNDAQSLAFLFDPSDDSFTTRFISGTGYSNGSPEIEKFGYSYMVTDVLDSLISDYSPDELTWWDIHCRLPLNRFGELLYDSNDSLHNYLSNGFRDNIKIKSVLARAYEDNMSFIDDDNIILRSEDRNAPSR